MEKMLKNSDCKNFNVKKVSNKDNGKHSNPILKNLLEFCKFEPKKHNSFEIKDLFR